MAAVRRRRWGARSCGAAACAGLLLALTGCGQARFAAPPEPNFTRGRPAEVTLPAATETTLATPDVPELSEVEPDLPPTTAHSISTDTVQPGGAPDSVPPEAADPAQHVATAPTGSIAVESMVIVDDAGIMVPNRSGWEAFDAALSRRLVPANTSASVAVMLDGQLVHQAAFGERIAGSGEPTEVTDRFRIASISKTITAIVIMQMVERGELALDEPVGQVVLDYLGVQATDPDATAITVRQLLHHSAGFGKHYSTFFGNGAVSYADAARIGMTGPVSGGAGYGYSNMNFAVLSVLIEAVTGRTYEQVVDERLLVPLGITGMRLAGTHELGPDEVSHHPTPGRNFMETLGGAGAWNATPSQVVAIYNSIDPTTPGWKALTPESMALMRAGVATGAPASSYGLGIINYPGDAWGHTGTIERAHSMVLVQPDGVTWAVSVSGETPSDTGALRGIVRAAMAAAFAD